MKKLVTIFICLLALLGLNAVTVNAQFINVSPVPGSKYHMPQTGLILRVAKPINETTIHNPALIEINGSMSGLHEWTARLSEGRTLLIRPLSAFDWGETVQVTVHTGLKTTDGGALQGTTFSFEIMNELTAEQKELLEADDDDEPHITRGSSAYDNLRQGCSTDSLPTYQVTINNNPTPGQIFHNNQSDDKKDTNSFPTIIENDGTVVWTCDKGISGHDFKINYNGYLTYFDYPADGWIVMDSNFNSIDTIQCGNGYESETNGHDIVMYPDGHTFVIAYNPQTVDMSQIVPGGKTNALVKGLIVQELDADKNVIFQWRSWDHFLITDINPTEDLTAGIIDLVHGNAVERDVDGNLLLSCRNMSEITKINLQTGDFVWRMGGQNNQFTFVNDNIPQHFNYQHDIRRLPNGNVTLFNNGVSLPVQRSSAKEYQLDEVNKVATLIWYYEHPMVDGANVFGSGSGSVQRLRNGNTLISWGKTINSTPNIPNYTEVDTAENIVWEFKFNDSLQRGYRVHRYTWQPCAVIAPEGIAVKNIKESSAKFEWNAVHNAVSYDLQFREVGKKKWKTKNATDTKKKINKLNPATGYEFQLRAICANGYTSDWTPLDTFITASQRVEASATPVAVLLYPSLVSDIVNVNITAASEKQMTLMVFNLSGQQVMSREINVFSGSSDITLDVSGLPAGYYIAQVQTQQQLLTQKFIKQ